ncbi:MAG TPA: hypothetical protein VFH06_03205 [Candidatus Saccharimonadales bacterium]|nr:hypothetical protein [Candidatus Saccharimonadales bacterium]
MLDGAMRRRGEEGEKILRIVALGEGPAPDQPELLPRYEAAQDIARLYVSLIGKIPILSYFRYFRFGWKATTFMESYDLPQKEG